MSGPGKIAGMGGIPPQRPTRAEKPNRVRNAALRGLASEGPLVDVSLTAAETRQLLSATRITPPKLETLRRSSNDFLSQAKKLSHESKSEPFFHSLEVGLEVAWDAAAPFLAGAGSGVVTAVHYTLTPVYAGIAIAATYLIRAFVATFSKVLDNPKEFRAALRALDKQLNQLKAFLKFAVDPDTVAKRYKAYKAFLREGKQPDPQIMRDLIGAAGEVWITTLCAMPAMLGAPALPMAFATAECFLINPLYLTAVSWSHLFSKPEAPGIAAMNHVMAALQDMLNFNA